MITEIATLTLRPGTEQEFAAVFPRAVENITSAKGYRSHSLRRSVETPNRFMLTVHWETLADHMVGFRESASFQQWRALVGPFFAAPPQVEHFE